MPRQQKIGLSTLASDWTGNISVVLLAAGEGKRLRPLTKFWPKCLMPIQGRPLLEHWLFALHKVVPLPIFVNTFYLKEIVEVFLDRDALRGLCKVSEESELLGTAGTLRNLYTHLKGKTLLVIHSDNWTDIDLLAFFEFHDKTRAQGTSISMATFEAEYPENCGIVECDINDVLINFHEKITEPPGNRANAAIYLMEPQVIEWIKENPDVSDISVGLIPEFLGDIRCFHHQGFHRDIGTIDQLAAAQGDQSKSIRWRPDEWLNDFRKSEIMHKVKRIIDG